MAKETAEQKLLKIIESAEAQPKQPEAPAQGQEVAQQIAASVKGVGLTAIPVSSTLDSFLNIFKGRTLTFGLREINIILFILSLIASGVLIKNFMSGMEFSNRKVAFMVDSKIAPLPKDLIPKFKEISDYLNQIKIRNIFIPFEKKVAVESTEALVVVQKVAEKTKDLKLVGISWLDTPDTASAMIENTASGITYFLKTGEKVNEVSIKSIYADTVVLTFEGEEIEFRL